MKLARILIALLALAFTAQVHAASLGSVTTGQGNWPNVIAPDINDDFSKYYATPFLTIGNQSVYSTERAITAGTCLTGTDNGANSSYIFGITAGCIGVTQLDFITGDVPADGDCLTYSTDAGGSIEAITCPGAGGGETNTASNVGSGGIGVFKQKTSVDLEFKKLVAGNTSIVILDDTGNSVVDLSVPASSATLAGACELATDGETVTGTDTVRCATPSGVAAAIAADASGAPVDIQTMTATGSGDSWDKPSGGQTLCQVEIWGGGGSGGVGAAAAAQGGGGGGGYGKKTFLMSSLGSTEQVTIAAGGAAISAASTAGNVGGNTTFGTSGTLVTAYGGGGGGTLAGGGGGGGAGGGFAAAGGTASGGTAGNSTGTGGGTAGGTAQSAGTVFGGGAGAGGAASDATTANGAGGAAFMGGGGGGAGAEDSSPGAGAGGFSLNAGVGGAGAFDASNATAGSQPGGGGGGAETGNSGKGGDGKALITCW